MIFLTKQGFKRSESELELYIKDDIILGLYVDDILISGKNIIEIEKVKKLLPLRFKMKDLGIAKRFLIINIEQRTDGISICLNDYIGKGLEKFNMSNANSVIRLY
jgi:hypothetical protein